MNKNLILITILSFLNVNILQSQLKETSVYGLISCYRDVGFENNGFGATEIGINFLNNEWISSEIGINYTFGKLEDVMIINTVDPNFSPESITETRINGVFGNVGPKLSFDKKESNVWFFFTPKMHFGNSKIKKDYFELSDERNRNNLIESVNSNEAQLFFSFSIGLEGYLGDSEKILLSFSIKYTTLQLRDQILATKFVDTSTHLQAENTQALGIALKISYKPLLK